MTSRRLTTNTKLLGRYGTGDDSSRPEYGRWRMLIGSGSNDMFIPEKTSAEREAVYNNFPYKYGSGAAYGLTSLSLLFDNTVVFGTGPCWNNGFAGTYNTPASCPSGFTQQGSVTNTPNINPNDWSGVSGIHQNDPGWLFYLEKDHGCTASFPDAGISVRYCSMTADEIGYV